MPRVFIQRPLSDHFIQKLTYWISIQESGYCFRGDGWGEHSKSKIDVLAGWGTFQKPKKAASTSSFIEHADDYVFMAIPYDHKNELEALESNNIDHIGFDTPQVCIPQFVVRIVKGVVEFGYRSETTSEQEALSTLEMVNKTPIQTHGFSSQQAEPKSRLTQNQYLETIEACKREIQLGNIYQSNICQEFYWEKSKLLPAEVFISGFASNPNPFAVYFKHFKTHCISWSPERFLSISGNTLLSQPMKGTAPRNKAKAIDDQNRTTLANSEKDRRENVMIVDMVRNDLSLFAKPGTVKVPELYRIETYPKVHQMYSTVTAELKPDSKLFETMTSAFPMASMTGAPKIRSMEVIERLEQTKRGLFSGSIGFVTPEKEVDSNVIIRSLLYNEATQYLSCHVGGGITDLSDPEMEYEECLTKISPIIELLNSMQA